MGGERERGGRQWSIIEKSRPGFSLRFAAAVLLAGAGVGRCVARYIVSDPASCRYTASDSAP